MTGPVRLFISHSSDDAALADALATRLGQFPDLQVLIDTSGLEPGKPWRRQLHEWMARCGAGIVLLTPAVLARPQWVLKEAIILAWRLDLERQFALFFALSPAVTREQVSAAGFELAQMSETQFLPVPADLAHLEELALSLHAQLPKVPAQTPFDNVVHEIRKLLRAADPVAATYADIAKHLRLTGPANWGPDQHDRLAEQIARAVVQGREDGLAINELVDLLSPWLKEHRRTLVNLLVPFWIDPQCAGALLRRAPPRPAPVLPPAAGPGALTIAGAMVPQFTAQMAVRRAFVTKPSAFRLAAAVGLASADLYADIRADLCEYARRMAWVPPALKNDDRVVAELRKSAAPVFVPLDTLPDAATLARLRIEFPRVLFIAPRPPGRIAAEGDELSPDPPPEREAAEFQAWELAMNAIDNS